MTQDDKRVGLLRATVFARKSAIALNGFGMKADVERALASGYDACLCKPDDPEDLIALIRQVHRGKI